MSREKEELELQQRQQQQGDGEANQKKLPYPKAVFFIVGNEFCERFSYYGMKAILSIYMKSKLHFSEDTATVIYHTFSLFCYFTPIFGAMLADQLLGKFKTIFYISIVYVLGHLLKTMAAVPSIGLPPVEFSLLGLALIAIGTGGIKPCVSAFGGDQFKLPEQERQLQTFFSLFYFSINSGSLLSTFLTPILRQDVKCFGDDTCYSLAFGIPALLMFLATVLLVIGRPLYVMKPPQGNVLTKVVGSITYALGRKFSGASDDVAHWLDRARPKYERNLLEDVKVLLRVLVLYLPLPVFWALFDQQGSRWTFQATRMNGAVGSFYTIKPDQMQLINPAFILILIPLFDAVIYPFFANMNLLIKPLQRISVGGALTATAFVISGLLETQLMQTYERVPSPQESHVHVMNALNCDFSLYFKDLSGQLQPKMFEVLANTNYVVDGLEGDVLFEIEAKIKDGCDKIGQEFRQKTINMRTKRGEVQGLLVRRQGSVVEMTELKDREEPEKTHAARIRVIFDLGPNESGSEVRSLELRSPSGTNKVIEAEVESVDGSGIQQSTYASITPDVYELYVEGERTGELVLGQGGVRNVLVTRDEEDASRVVSKAFELTSDNSIHMLWMVPQYFVITTGEIMFSITGLEFSYSQAPESMKSVVQAAWLLTVAFGNLIVIVVAESKFFASQAMEFFMFAALMYIDVIVFAMLAHNYTYVEGSGYDNEEEKRLKQRKGLQNDAYGSSSTDL